MNTKILKIVVGTLCVSTAVAMTYRTNPKAADAEKQAVAAKGANDLQITSPAKAADYGVGTYKVEGLVPKGSDVTLYLDRKELKTLQANSEDGSFLEEIQIGQAGKHTLVAEYKDAKGQKVLKKLEFKASAVKNSTKPTEDLLADNHDDNSDNEPGAAGNEPARYLPSDDEDVKYPDDPKDPNSASHRAENEVKASKAPAKPTAPKPKNPTSKKPAAKAKFAISSYANFNVVPHGIVKIGGKGKAGDKVMLLIDNKPSMKGTVKPDGRWKFPVKISSPGFRTITAKNLTTNEKSTIKLKIK